jgi:hypothetical protein
MLSYCLCVPTKRIKTSGFDQNLFNVDRAITRICPSPLHFPLWEFILFFQALFRKPIKAYQYLANYLMVWSLHPHHAAKNNPLPTI